MLHAVPEPDTVAGHAQADKLVLRFDAARPVDPASNPLTATVYEVTATVYEAVVVAERGVVGHWGMTTTCSQSSFFGNGHRDTPPHSKTWIKFHNGPGFPAISAGRGRTSQHTS